MILEARTMKLLPALVVFAGSCFAGEYAVFSSGFRIHADRHENDGAVVRLYLGDGVTELPAEYIGRFEAEEEIPKPAAAAPPVTQPPSVQQLVTSTAERKGLPPEFVHSVVAAESAYRADAVSRKGAIGLMQLMPATAREYGADPNDPRQNAEAGTQYLRDLLVKYQRDDHQVSRALAAYNAGTRAVDRYGGVPPYRETRDYVVRVIRTYEKAQRNQAAKPIPPSAE